MSQNVQRNWGAWAASARVAIAAALAIGPVAGWAVSGVVISQVYGGGGNSGATYTHDFIELMNRGATTVSVSGWSVQYASASGTTWQVTPIAGTIAPGRYYLIQQAHGSGGTTFLPTPDAVGTIAMSATAGKVALVDVTTALTGTCPLASAVDFVGYGTTANCFEGAGATGALSNTMAALRKLNGCQDTDQNGADFDVALASPRNSVTPANPCVPVGVEASTWERVKALYR